MPLSRTVLERQLKQAELSLAERVKALKSAGKAAEAYGLDPVWRNANAACSSIRRRLVSVSATEANNAEVTRRKLEPKPEPVKAEKAAPKAAKAKGDKPKEPKGDKPKAAAKSDEPKPKKAKAGKAE